MLRCTCLGWRVASMPKTSPFPTESETESRARTTSPRRFLKLFSTPRNSNAFTTTPPVDTLPGGAPALQAPPGLQPLPDGAPGLLALGGYRQLEEAARHPTPQGGFSGRLRVPP